MNSTYSRLLPEVIELDPKSMAVYDVCWRTLDIYHRTNAVLRRPISYDVTAANTQHVKVENDARQSSKILAGE